MTTEPATKIAYVRVESTLDDVAYEVVADGTALGRVVRNREVRRERYAGRRYGKDIASTVWRYQTADRGSWRRGPTTETSRDRAALSLLTSEHGYTIDAAGLALGKPAGWA